MRITKRRAEMGEEKWEEYQKQRRSRNVINCRKRTKWKLVLYKGGKCQECGYNKGIPAAYSFHHRDKKEKELQIAKSYDKSLKRLKKEVDKCDLLCCRCHMELHDKEDYNQ